MERTCPPQIGHNVASQLVRQVDADGVTTLFAYNAEGDQEVTAIDLNGNNAVDYEVDRITRTTTGAIEGVMLYLLP